MHTRIVLRALKVSYSNVDEGGVAVNCEKNTIFLDHPGSGVYCRRGEGGGKRIMIPPPPTLTKQPKKM